MGNTDLDACVQVVKQTASLSSLIADALRNKRDIPTFVVDVSNILHAQLHAHDMDIVLRNSWKGFEQGIENILKIHASWFAPYDPVTYIRRVVHYTEEVPLQYMIYVFDGATFTDKRANLLREIIRCTANIRIQKQIELGGLDSEFSKNDIGSAVGAFNIEAAERTRIILNRLGMRHTQALGEAEHEMYSLMQTGVAQKGLSYDTDFSALMIDGVFLDNKGTCFRGVLRYLPKFSALLEESTLAILSKGAGGRKASVMDKQLAFMFENYKLLPLQVLRCVFHNDYSNTPGVGPTTGVNALYEVLKNFFPPSSEPPQIASIFNKLSTYLLSIVNAQLISSAKMKAAKAEKLVLAADAQTAATAAAAASNLVASVIQTPINYDSLKKDALKAMCRERGLLLGGNKNDLLMRLSSSDLRSSSATAATSTVDTPPSTGMGYALTSIVEVSSTVDTPSSTMRGASTSIVEVSSTVDSPSSTMRDASTSIVEVSSTVNTPSSTMRDASTSIVDVSSTVDTSSSNMRERDASTSVVDASSTVDTSSSTMRDASTSTCVHPSLTSRHNVVNCPVCENAYDKGLSSYYDFEKAGIVVILPDKKHEGQIVFSGKSQEGGRDVAGGRIIIENLNEQLKLYDMFGAVKYISRLDMVEHELNFVRFLVNLKPVVNDWNSKTAHTF